MVCTKDICLINKLGVIGAQESALVRQCVSAFDLFVSYLQVYSQQWTKPLSKVRVSNNESNTNFDPEVCFFFVFCTVGWSIKLTRNWDIQSFMLPWKLQKRQILAVNQNFSSVYFSLAKFQLVRCNLSLAMIWQMTHTHKLLKLCSDTLTRKAKKRQVQISKTTALLVHRAFLYISSLHGYGVIENA